jgi:hypothetical protein
VHEVEVHKDELLEKLQRNRDNHRATFEKALEGYKRELYKELNYRISELTAGRVPNRHIQLPEPEDHTNDYDRVITMVEMSVSDTIKLTAQEFAQFVMDDWGWKQAFTNTSQRYIS